MGRVYGCMRVLSLSLANWRQKLTKQKSTAFPFVVQPIKNTFNSKTDLIQHFHSAWPTKFAHKNTRKGRHLLRKTRVCNLILYGKESLLSSLTEALSVLKPFLILKRKKYLTFSQYTIVRLVLLTRWVGPSIHSGEQSVKVPVQ